MKYIQRSLNKKMKLSIKDFFSKCPNLQFPEKSHTLMKNLFTACKVPKYEVFSGPYFPAFGLNTDQKKLRIWTLFTLCFYYRP